MARKRHSDEDILKLLREIEVKLSSGSDVQSACHGVGIRPPLPGGCGLLAARQTV